MNTTQKFEAEAFNAELGVLNEKVEALTLDLATQSSMTEGLRRTLNDNRDAVKSLFTQINDYIEDNDLEEDGDIPLSELDAILMVAFNNRLTFEKVYEVQVSYTMDVTFEVRAKSEHEAREIAEDISISQDPAFDHDEDPIELVIDNVRVGYASRKDS